MHRPTVYLATLLLAGLISLAPTASAQSAVDCPNTVRAVNGCDDYTPSRVAQTVAARLGDATTRGGGLSVLYAPSEADDPAYRAAIAAALGAGATVDYFDATLGTPSVADLQAYDAVYTWANFAYADPVAFGDNLAAYVDGGGVVVLGVFTTYDSGNSLGGAIRGAAYSPVANPTGSNHFLSSNYAGDGAIFYDGVSPATECLFRDFLVPQGSGAVDGHFVDGEIMGAYRPDFGVMYMNGDGASALGCTGDWARLLANMILEGAGGGTPGCEQSITATLDDPTPSPGQTITFAVTVTNNAASAATLDLWIDASGPANLRKRLARGTLPAGATVTRNVRVRVPGNAPSGAYAVDLNIGDFGADDICDTASFTVTVSAPRMGAGASDTEWEAAVEGDFFAAASATTAGASAVVAPNPFARQTTISYEVAAASDVRLAVYDVLGREVAVLVDARQEAGTHRATFDASGLAAGTYVYRLVVGNDVQTGRLTLAH